MAENFPYHFKRAFGLALPGILLLPALGMTAAFLSCRSKLPPDRSAVLLTIEREDEETSSPIVFIGFYLDDVEMEKWGFLTEDEFPYRFEIWTKLEGDFQVRAVGYTCPGGDCGNVEGREEFVRARGSEVVTLVHGEKRPLRVVLEKYSPLSCGNGTLDENEECDDGNGDPSDGCLPDCSYSLRPFSDGAGGPGDSFAAFALLKGFVVAWTEGAGDDDWRPDEIAWMRFDENGIEMLAVPEGDYPDSCAGNEEAVFSSLGLSGWGNGGPFALLLFGECLSDDLCSLCLSRMDESGQLQQQGKLADSGLPGFGRIPVEMIDERHAATVGLEDGTFILLAVDFLEGREAGRALIESVREGEEVSSIEIRLFAGSLLAAVWQTGSGDGRISSWVRRWSLGGRKELLPLDTAPLLIGEEDAPGVGKIGLAPGRHSDSIIFVRTAGSGIEALWIEGNEGSDAFERVTAAVGFSPLSWVSGCRAAPDGAAAVLVASPIPPGEETCAYMLIRIPEPGTGEQWKVVETWGEEESLGCSAELVGLSGGRAAVVFSALKEVIPGTFRGELSLDIVGI